jgi:magnesium transporter
MGEVVNCASYAGGRKVADVAVDDVSEVLNVPGQFVWLGLVEPSEELLAKIQQEFHLHDLAVEDAHRAHQRPKLEEYGESIFVVLRTAQLVDGKTDFGETHVFVGDRYVVTIRHGASLPYTGVRARLESAPRLLAHGPSAVLYAIMDFVVDNYFPIVHAYSDRLEDLEDTIFGDRFTRETTEDIYALKRDLVALKRAVTPLIEVCNRLVRYDVGMIAEEIRVYFRDVYDHVVRINESLDTQRELITTALEANLSLISVRQNEVMKKLAAWAAILAVPTMIAGVYGMNFEFMPGLHFRWGYELTIAAMGGACLALYAWFKRTGWL